MSKYLDAKKLIEIFVELQDEFFDEYSLSMMEIHKGTQPCDLDAVISDARPEHWTEEMQILYGQLLVLHRMIDFIVTRANIAEGLNPSFDTLMKRLKSGGGGLEDLKIY